MTDLLTQVQEAHRDLFKPHNMWDVWKEIKKNWVLDPDTGTYFVDGDVILSDMELEYIPHDFSEVTGTFSISRNPIRDLHGCPRKVGGNFWAQGCLLESLEGGPEQVGNGYHVDSNLIKSVVGVPKNIPGDFFCTSNKLTVLHGGPEKVGGDFYCSDNQLTELLGGPKYVGGDYDCDYNHLKSLIGSPQHMEGIFTCVGNRLDTLKRGPRSCHLLCCGQNNSPVKILELTRPLGSTYRIVYDADMSGDVLFSYEETPE